MTCAETSNLIHAYSDSELDLVRALELEKHLGACDACRRGYENVRNLKAVLKSGEHYFRAPAGLKRRVRSTVGVDEPKPQGAAFPWWRLFKIAIPLAAIVIIVALLMPALIGRSADERLAQEVTSSHVRSLMAGHRTDIASSDQHTVKPWFEGKLDFAPPVVDLAAHGFPLVGGRLDYLDGKTVAALVYQRQKHFINLFIWPASTNAKKAQKTAIQRGYNLVHWTASGMTFWAVSDLNLAELKEFVQLVASSS